MEERRYSVYLHRNLTNGKVYIGITSQKPWKRWDSGWGYQKNKHFWDSIQKYGWDAFEHTILFSGLTPEEAFTKERELIAEYDSCDYRKGYNCSPGGEFGFLGASGENHPMYGKHHTEEAKAKMSASRKGKPYSPERLARFRAGLDREALRERALKNIAGFNRGVPKTEEHKRKIAESNRGKKRSPETCRKVGEARRKPILQYTREGVLVQEWDSIKSAAIKINIQPGHISKVCTGQRKTAGGYIWRHKQ